MLEFFFFEELDTERKLFGLIVLLLDSEQERLQLLLFLDDAVLESP